MTGLREEKHTYLMHNAPPFPLPDLEKVGNTLYLFSTNIYIWSRLKKWIIIDADREYIYRVF